jgi:hypothetical protein
MSDKTKQYIGYAIVLIAVIVAGVLGYSYPLPAPPADESDVLLRLNALEQAAQFSSFSVTPGGEGYTNLTSLELSEDLYVGDDATIVGDLDAATITTANLVSQTVSFSATGTTSLLTTTATNLTASGNVVVTGTSSLVGNVTLSALLKPGFADETITNGETLTPTKTVYALDSAGAVTMTLAASASEGQLLFLVGDDANTITIADTNIRSTDGNAITVGQYDAVAFVYQDSEWIELLKSANQ